MATDMYCPHQDCIHIRESGLCDRSVVSMVFSTDWLICENHETETPAERDRRTEKELEEV